MTEWMERHQIALYVVTIVAGFGAGILLPGAQLLEVVINPAIGLLLYVTFLGVPFTRIGAAFRDARFLVTLFILNFALVPAIVFGLSRFVAHDAALLIGVLLVLLTPCIDYVIVFSALAGGAHEKLLAAAPLLMIAQLLLLPVYLWAFAGPSTVGSIEAEPFVEAFLVLIALPLIAAAATQWAAARTRVFRSVSCAGAASMVPLMMLVLFIVVASQSERIASAGPTMIPLVPLYAAFLVVMAGVGILVARVARLDTRSARALTFSGATRNSLVVLPLALALPAGLAIAPAVVVTQTLVELIGMVIYVRVVPILVPGNRASATRR
jgi:ACR3 family arsenite efflux pump ArsB